MKKTDENTLMEIINKFDIESYCKEKLRKARSTGDELGACCPFHEDRNPSFSINIKTGMFKCHSCSASGDFFDLYQHIQDVDFHTCLNELCNLTGISKQQKLKGALKSNTTPLISGFDVGKWCKALQGDEKRLEHLMNIRGISADIISQEEIGWNGCRYTIPIRDKTGKLVNVRLYDPDSRSKMINLKGYGSPARLYGVDTINRHDTDEIIITEGEFDRLVLECYGFTAVTGTGGCKTWRQEWSKTLSTKAEGRGIIILYDADDAGKNAAHNIVAPSLLAEGIQVKIATLPPGPWKDVTDWHLANRPQQELHDAILNAKPVNPETTAVPFTIGTWFPEVIEILKERKEKSYSPVPTGIPSLDIILGGGLERGQISLLCAPPGSGKTSIAVDWGFNFALNTQGPTIFWSLEMGKVEIASRIVSLRATLPWAEVIRGQHVKQSEAICEQFQYVPFTVYTREDFRFIKKFEELASKITEVYDQPPFVIIDYVQLLANTQVNEIRQAVEDVSTELASMANRLDLPILALSSVNRQSYNLLKGNQPDLSKMLAMAKESGKFEFDAGVVLGIAQIHDEDDPPREKKAWIGVAKNRLGGGLGAVAVSFDGLSGRFTEIPADEITAGKGKTQQCKDKIKQAIYTAESKGAPIRNTRQLQDYVRVSRQFLLDCLSELMNSGEIVKDGKFYKLTS